MVLIAVPGRRCARGRRAVRYVRLDASDPLTSTREYLRRQRRAPADKHTTVLVVTRGVEQSAALLLAADTLSRQLHASGDVSPVSYLTHLRSLRPRWFTEVDQVKMLYDLLCDVLPKGDGER
ncbi:uncharacterized protein LOC119106911 [Pollicipes pollicipes]|uniref:uncharacterized protein LOC119106911 n=1 Tax=Pollicipes pollicipes TaxID=41117 RepID=UPI001884CA0D|nr:uncharacterized protein LOC119106911 [Pollicipes pollicipes]